MKVRHKPGVIRPADPVVLDAQRPYLIELLDTVKDHPPYWRGVLITHWINLGVYASSRLPTHANLQRWLDANCYPYEYHSWAAVARLFVSNGFDIRLRFGRTQADPSFRENLYRFHPLGKVRSATPDPFPFQPSLTIHPDQIEWVDRYFNQPGYVISRFLSTPTCL